MVIAPKARGVLLICLVVLTNACSTAEDPPAPSSRVQFLIGLGNLRGPRDLSISVENEDGSVRSFSFDQKKADAQRAKAIEGGPRDGTSYQLNDDEGQSLPVFWKPWAPRVAARELEVPAASTTMS